MSRTLYDLAAADPNLRFSPYCWRVKLALAHKGLAYDSIPWRFTEKEAIAISGQTLVPVLIDGGTVLHDSQTIAEYLEVNYPHAPSLFGDSQTRALTRFIKQWTEDVLHPAIVKIVLPDIFQLIDPKDQPYFRQTRETRLHTTIEAMAAARATHLPALQTALTPLRHTLAVQDFLAGASPAYADHIVFGALQWARLTSSTKLLEDDDPIHRWMAALTERYRL